MLPWLVWLHGLSAGLRTERLLVQFPVKAHAWVSGKVPSHRHVRGDLLMFLSLSFSIPSPISKNKYVYFKSGTCWLKRIWNIWKNMEDNKLKDYPTQREPLFHIFSPINLKHIHVFYKNIILHMLFLILLLLLSLCNKPIHWPFMFYNRIFKTSNLFHWFERMYIISLTNFPYVYTPSIFHN